jgi:LacI family transcriptional regulator
MGETTTKQRRSKDPSIADVARLAGVSVGTVSNVLNRPERVNPAMRARVLEAIEELGFQRNHVARSLRERRTMTLGLVLSDVTTPFASVLARVVQSRASAAGYTVVFADNDEDVGREQDAVFGLYRNGVDGIILAPSPGDQSYLNELLDKGWPVIAVNRRVQGASVPAVLTDHYGGAVQATDHLIGHGAKRIGVVTRSPDISSISDRHAGYEDALEGAGIPFDPELVVEDEPTVEGGRRAALRLLRVPKGRRPDAVMSFSTAMTLGCVIAFRELGVRVPRDLRFLAFDDATWSVAMEPPLTSVALRARHVGTEATDRLIDWIRNGTKPEVQELIIPTNLIVRRSCGCGQEEDR